MVASLGPETIWFLAPLGIAAFVTALLLIRGRLLRGEAVLPEYLVPDALDPNALRVRFAAVNLRGRTWLSLADFQRDMATLLGLPPGTGEDLARTRFKGSLEGHEVAVGFRRDSVLFALTPARDLPAFTARKAAWSERLARVRVSVTPAKGDPRAARALARPTVARLVEGLSSIEGVVSVVSDGDGLIAVARQAGLAATSYRRVLEDLARIAKLLGEEADGPTVVASARAPAEGRCAFCHGEPEKVAFVPCSECGVLLHEACWTEHGRCPSIGCGGRGRPRVTVALG